MRTGIQILRDVQHVLHAVCGCDRIPCLPCAQRREVVAYLAVADGNAKQRSLEVVP